MPWIGNGVSAIWRRKRKLEDLVEVDFDRTDHGELKIDQRYDLPIVSEHVHLAEIAVVEHLAVLGRAAQKRSNVSPRTTTWRAFTGPAESSRRNDAMAPVADRRQRSRRSRAGHRGGRAARLPVTVLLEGPE
jgi:hypothetical protein